MPTVRKLQFANGVVITEPTDLTLEAATNQLPVYIDDAAYDADNDVTEGSIYLNTTLKAPRMYIGGVWRTGIMQNNATDATKQVVLDTDGALTGVTHTLDFNGTASRVYTFPDTTATVVVTLGAQELEEKTIKNGFLDGTKIRNGALDVEAAGALTIGATVGANNLTLGGSGSTVQIPGNLTVSGTTTTVNTDTLDVEDKNITVNKGGNDALSEGAGLTVDRTGTKGSIIYKDLAPNKFAAGALGSEKNLAAIDDITATNFSGTLPTSKGGTGQNSTATFPTSGTVATTADITAANFSGILASSNGGTGVNNAGSLTYGANNVTLTTSAATSVTLPTSGTLATLAGSEQLSNKTLVEPVLDNFIDINEEAAPVAPGAGKIRVYAKADGKLYKKDDTGAESEVGSGGAGTGRNYLQDFYDATKVVSVSATTLAPTANRASDRDLWARSTVAGLTVENNAVSPLRQAGDYLINSSASTIASFVETPCFSIDNADLGKPLSVEFDLSGVAASTSYDVVVVRYNSAGTYQETIVVAGTASAGSPASAQLPTGTGKFKGFFIPSATSTDLYAIRLRKVAAVDDDFQIDSLFVGPGSSIQGAIVTAWQDYTPTISNITIGNGSVSAKWRRVGTNLEGRIQFESGTTSTFANTDWTFSIPLGLNIDSSVDSGNIGYHSFGVASGRFNDGVDGEWRTGLVGRNNATSVKVFITPNATNYTAYSWKQSTTGVLNNLASTTFSLYFNIPIAEWSSGTTTLADRAVEEYAFNNSSATNGNSNSFAYGTQGTPFLSYSSGANVVNIYTVRFQTPILSTDKIVIEASPNRSVWHEIPAYALSGGNTISQFGHSTTSYFGVGIRPILNNSTDIDVVFGGAGTNSNLDAWSSFSGWYWRVRKVSGGAAVGYPVSARNIVGDTSGTAVPSLCVGQIISGASDAPTTVAATNTDKVVTTLSLSPGNWLIIGSVYFDPSGTSTNRMQSSISTGTFSGAGTIINVLGLDYIEGSFGLSSGYVVGNFNFPANISSQTTFNVNARLNYTGTPSIANPLRASIRAVRIA